MAGTNETRMRVGLFATCLVDFFRPQVGFATARLLEDAGCEVVVPEQTCCGQPAYNAGRKRDAATIARRVIDAFAEVDYMVVPSGSCAATVRRHYPRLFDDDPAYHAAAEDLAGRTWELTAFLDEVCGYRPEGIAWSGTVTYHDACSGLRELHIREQPRRLLKSIEGLTLSESEGCTDCCGFGGTFCVKYPEISTRMVDDKCNGLTGSGADTVLSGDLGCLLNIAGRLSRRGSPIRARHVAEVLAGMIDTPPIGEHGES